MYGERMSKDHYPTYAERKGLTRILKLFMVDGACENARDDENRNQNRSDGPDQSQDEDYPGEKAPEDGKLNNKTYLIKINLRSQQATKQFEEDRDSLTSLFF